MSGLAGRLVRTGGACLLVAGVPAMTFASGSPAPHQQAAVVAPRPATGNESYRLGTAGPLLARGWAPPGVRGWGTRTAGQPWGVPATMTASQLQGVLAAVTAVTSSDVWAVGLRCAPDCMDADRTLIRHWNGSVWSTVAGPNPSPVVNELYSVSADSARDAWAVGDNFRQVAPGTQAAGTLTVHWNGQIWSKVASPKVGTDETSLLGVSALSPTNAWAVGEDFTSSGRTITLILHWNGQAWIRVPSPSPSPAFNVLSGVRALAAGNAWAVGQYTNLRTGAVESLLLHWNGQAWSRVASPNPSTAGNGLFALSATSATDVWAAGGYCAKYCWGTAEVDASLILHWNGQTWSRVASPSPGVLQAVSARSAANAWAVGGFCSSACNTPSETDRSVTMHWNGLAWSKVPVPHPATEQLHGISTVSAAGAWAVGSSCGTTCAARTPTYHPLILHWDGLAWSVKG